MELEPKTEQIHYVSRNVTLSEDLRDFANDIIYWACLDLPGSPQLTDITHGEGMCC